MKNLPLSVVFVYLYFLSLMMLGTCVLIIFMTTVLDALADNSYKMHSYRLQCGVLLCAICNGIAVLFTTPVRMRLTKFSGANVNWQYPWQPFIRVRLHRIRSICTLREASPQYHRPQDPVCKCQLVQFATRFFSTSANILQIRQTIDEWWDKTGNGSCIVVIMTLYAVATMWIYGASRIQSDIEFKYKTKFSITFWLTCWKCFPFLALVSFYLVLSVLFFVLQF